MDERKLSGYIEKYHGNIFRLAYGYLKNSHDAEDIVQEAFLKLYMSKTCFEKDDNVKAWLIRVSINLCKDRLRSFWFKNRSELPMDIPFENKEEDVLLSLINKLKPEHRAVIILFYYEDYSIKEIAKILRISESAVTTRLSRARKKFKDLLLKEGYNEK